MTADNAVFYYARAFVKQLISLIYQHYFALLNCGYDITSSVDKSSNTIYQIEYYFDQENKQLNANFISTAYNPRLQSKSKTSNGLSLGKLSSEVYYIFRDVFISPFVA